MEIMRNFISITGLVNENDLPHEIKGQVVQYSETETIFIPDHQPDVKSIFQIIIKVEITNSRKIKTPGGYTIIIDGIKKLKIIYTQNNNSDRANFLDLELPYNTYIELPEYTTLENISVYILDAYFSLLDNRKIYSHFLYLVNVSVVSSKTNSIDKYEENNIKEYYPIDEDILQDIQNTPILESPDDTFNDTKDDNSSNGILIDLDAEYL